MPWISLTPADLDATKLAPLMDALSAVARAPGQGDPLLEIIANATLRIRRMIAACRTNTVDADETTIPASLKSLASRMVVREAKDRLEIELTETEKEAWRVDERELTRISNCELPIEVSDNSQPPEVQQTQPGPSIKARRRQFRDQDGV